MTTACPWAYDLYPPFSNLHGDPFLISQTHLTQALCELGCAYIERGVVLPARRRSVKLAVSSRFEVSR